MSDAVGASASFQPLTPLRFLERSAAVFPEKVAIIDGPRRLTYREFAAEAARVSFALRSSGVRPGDRVAYLASNCAELLIAHFAVPLSGAVLVALNGRLAPAELAWICSHAQAQLLVASPELAEGASEVIVGDGGLRERVCLGDGERPGWTSYAELRARGSDAEPDWTVADELSAISVNYTSGTTGRPKGVVYHHRGAYLNALGELLHSAHTPASVYLWTLPMFHCNGWCTTWAVTGIGGTHVCLPQVRGDEVWRLIDEHRVTHLNGAPTVLTTIVGDPAAHRLDRELVITTAGAAPSPTTIASVESLGARVVHVYGLTEVYGPYAVCEPQDAWQDLPTTQRTELLARQGVGMLQAERMRVVDDAMEDVPADGKTLGEFVMRGNNVMLGYLDDPAATEQAFRGGWFHSGDLGVMHPDGYAQLLDRAKDIVISGGENISTVEVENSLMSHPAVLEAAIVGVPHERWGERPRAFVVLKSGAAADERELIDHVRARLAHFKAPDSVLFLDALPRTSTGKVTKHELRGG